MKIGVLLAGRTPASLVDAFGSDDNMLRRLLGPAFKLKTFNAPSQELPSDDDDCEAYLISGSEASVLDDELWIRDLERFVQQRAGSKPMIGICFGHQLIAKALGGEVIHAPRGFEIGLQRYEVASKALWMDTTASFALPAIHEDQVVGLPPDARSLAGNLNTPFALIDYPDRRILSLQAHPEFDPAYAKALIELQRGSGVSDQAANAAIDTLDEEGDRKRVSVWLRRFLNSP